MQRIRPILRFYSGFAAICWFITILCAQLVYVAGPAPLLGILVLKAITLFFVYYFVKEIKKKELFFYYNLGLSRNTIFLYSFAIDTTLFLLSLIIAINVR